MRLHNSFINEFDQMEGTAFFPYLNKDITVVCRKGVSPEYTEKCLEYLEEMDDALMLQICKYAEFFLKDTLENTSVGELGDEEAFPYDSLMDYPHKAPASPSPSALLIHSLHPSNTFQPYGWFPVS